MHFLFVIVSGVSLNLKSIFKEVKMIRKNKISTFNGWRVVRFVFFFLLFLSFVLSAYATDPRIKKMVPDQPGEITPQSIPRPIAMIKPMIESFFDMPAGPLKPGTKLYLNGKDFGTQPGKILMYGKFPNSPIELHNIQWVSDKKVNGVVPMFMDGQANQKVSIRVQRSDKVLSNAKDMNFVGRVEYTCEEEKWGSIIYGTDGSKKDCTPYRCYSDNMGVHCWQACTSTQNCAKGYQCSSDYKCIKPPKTQKPQDPGWW